MKNHFLRLLSLVLLVLFLSGCSLANGKYQVPVTYYYIATELEFGTDFSIMKATTREAKGYEEDYFYLISQYLNGPTTYDCISPFPAGTVLEELNWDRNRVQIVLSPHITTLSGTDLIVACACLTETVAGMIGVDTVRIRSSSGLLNGEAELTLQAGNFIYQDLSSASDVFDR